MFRRKLRRKVTEVNAGSMADIAFLLLIFFLVTTTILEEEGVLVRLPVWDDEPISTPLDTERVLTVALNGKDELLVEGKRVGVAGIPSLVENHLNRPDFPTTQAVVSLTHDRRSGYETYLAVYDALLNGYRRVRDQEANNTYGKPYAELDDTRRREIRRRVPLVLSEAEPTDFVK